MVHDNGTLRRPHHNALDPAVFHDRLDDAGAGIADYLQEELDEPVIYKRQGTGQGAADESIEPGTGERGYNGLDARIHFYPTDDHLGTRWGDDPDPIITVYAWVRGGMEMGDIDRRVEHISDAAREEYPALVDDAVLGAALAQDNIVWHTRYRGDD